MNGLDFYRPDIIKLCETHKVKSLYAFGSVLTDSFNKKSDIDLIVDFFTDVTHNFSGFAKNKVSVIAKSPFRKDCLNRCVTSVDKSLHFVHYYS